VQFELNNEEDYSYESTESKEKVEQPTLVIRRSERVGKLVKMYSPHDFHTVFMLISTDDEPKSVGEAVDSTKGKLWKHSMVEEMEYLHKNETWELVELPSGIKFVGRKWVLNVDFNLVQLFTIKKISIKEQKRYNGKYTHYTKIFPLKTQTGKTNILCICLMIHCLQYNIHIGSRRIQNHNPITWISQQP